MHHLFVSPKHLRRGVGLKLLNHAKSRSENLSLKCLVHNTQASEFYISQGFTIQETADKGNESYHLMSFEEKT
ncbi:GNAT family N-acetyltransferase [Vibrio sp. MA40-2]|uniref:GNAT family N-acetyltransferase n=1 Tax=Vibrio sp. MA40-2 TaxID=3391828 RepID=UPI0039A4F2BC